MAQCADQVVSACPLNAHIIVAASNVQVVVLHVLDGWVVSTARVTSELDNKSVEPAWAAVLRALLSSMSSTRGDAVMTDPRNYYDDGWEDAIDDGHQFEENWLVDQASSGIHGPYNTRRPSLDTEYHGKNEPEDAYFS